MIYVIGTYGCRADSKGRILFPSGLKGQLEECIHKGFVLKRGLFGNYLELYPINEWKNTTEKILNKTQIIEKSSDFLRKFVAGAKFIELDTMGRIQIPKDLFTFANLKKEIVLTSVINKIEIWDKSCYESAIEYNVDEFVKITEEILGDFEK
ncbi:MAG: division/cell wall cluster transcriptional repressor MraZ [Hyphomicrobiales bacterium]